MNIETVTFERAVKMLDALGAQYHIQYGDKVIGKPLHQKTARTFKYKHGEIKRYVLPYLIDLPVGGVAQIPVGSFDLDSIQSAACRLSVDLFGKSQSLSHRNGDCVEVLRY